MFITLHVQRERGKMIGVGVRTHNLYVYMYGCGQKKWNLTLAIDPPFQTFVEGLLIKFIALPLLSPEMFSSSSKSMFFLYNVHAPL